MRKHIGLLTAGIILLIGGFFLFNQQKSQKTSSTPVQQTKEKGVAMSAEKETVMKQGDSASSYSGTVLAGTTSPYLVFNQADYDKAKQAGKIIFLEFFANWCPICRAQAPKLSEGFDVLNDSNVVGFRVNYNDPETDDVEKQLAKDFGVTYQHTHVIVKDGKAVSKTNDNLDKDSFVSLIESVK